MSDKTQFLISEFPLSKHVPEPEIRKLLNLYGAGLDPGKIDPSELVMIDHERMGELLKKLIDQLQALDRE